MSAISNTRKFYSIGDYSNLLSVISKELSGSRTELLRNIVELGKEKFWEKWPSIDCYSFITLLHNFARNNYTMTFIELWQAYGNDRRKYFFSSGQGKNSCLYLYTIGNKELLKEFLFYYANGNEAALKDICNFIDNIDKVLNRYVSNNLDEINRSRIVYGKIEKTLPKLIEILNRHIDGQESDISNVQTMQIDILSTELSECDIFKQLQNMSIKD
ncbi:MAG: hypothetical protein QWI36_04580 [Wolbachia endosymbiont of Tyrophagus putrescentiae]|nr:hypothetical protein [Wolbachia endosymbiont of Tyrophagus putrescentiae]